MSTEPIRPGQVWLYKPDTFGETRIVIDRTEMEWPDDGMGFVYAHNEKTNRRTRLRAHTLWRYYRLTEGGDSCPA